MHFRDNAGNPLPRIDALGVMEPEASDSPLSAWQSSSSSEDEDGGGGGGASALLPFEGPIFKNHS